MDVAAIEPGRDFRKAIDQSVANCSVLLAMIGLNWLDSKDALGRRRLDDANDFVRIELASALRRDIAVVPVLVRGAKMPQVEQLSDDLKELAYRNAVELTHARWKSDVQVLIRALRAIMDVPEANPSPANGSHPAKEPAVQDEEIASRQSSERRFDAAPVLAPAMIERITRELAAYIGPVSEIVVKRAAKKCSSEEDLYGIVAREIEPEKDRAKFLGLRPFK
jgi:hypothetical protein